MKFIRITESLPVMFRTLWISSGYRGKVGCVPCTLQEGGGLAGTSRSSSSPKVKVKKFLSSCHACLAPSLHRLPVLWLEPLECVCRSSQPLLVLTPEDGVSRLTRYCVICLVLCTFTFCLGKKVSQGLTPPCSLP